MHETTAPSAKTAIFDEMHTPEGGVRTHYQEIASQLFSLPLEALSQKQREAEMLFRRMGITFAVYGEGSGAERLIPFDVIPRVFGASEWALLERGLKQRVQALNAFLHDIYHDQEIIKAGLIPAEQVLGNRCMRTSPGSIWCGSRKTTFTCWKTTCAPRPACPTCWKTATP